METRLVVVTDFRLGPLTAAGMGFCWEPATGFHWAALKVGMMGSRLAGWKGRRKETHWVPPKAAAKAIRWADRKAAK